MTDFSKMIIRSNNLTRFIRNRRIEMWLNEETDSKGLEYQISSTWSVKRL